MFNPPPSPHNRPSWAASNDPYETPYTSPENIQVNHILRNNLIPWTMSCPPSTVPQRFHSQLSVRATAPGCSRMTIDLSRTPPLVGCDAENRWGPLQVNADSPSGEVTIQNVMDAIYAYLNTPVNSLDCAVAPRIHPQVINEARIKRMNSSTASYLEDRTSHALRIDLLGPYDNLSYFTFKVISFRGGHCKLSLELPVRHRN